MSAKMSRDDLNKVKVKKREFTHRCAEYGIHWSVGCYAGRRRISLSLCGDQLRESEMSILKWGPKSDKEKAEK